jgi:hypothetical protein
MFLLVSAAITQRGDHKMDRAHEIIDDLESEYQDFHSTLKGLEGWRAKKSAQLLWSNATVVNAAYLRRAERYVRSMYEFRDKCDQVADYLQRKNATK